MKNLALKNQFKWIGIFCILFCEILSHNLAYAQYETIRFQLTSIPESTPDSSQIYLVSSLNNWLTQDEKYQLQKDENGQYYIEIPKTDQPFQYKFTRGDWKNVEGNTIGDIRPNRFYEPYYTSPIDIEIQSWQDQVREIGKHVLIVITDIPEETPFDASLFLAADFNNWSTHNPEYKFNRDDDGHYYLKLPFGVEKFDFKITRGSWDSVEGRENGRAISNRKFDVTKDDWRHEIKISSWEDLSGKTMTPYMLLLLLSSFQGLMLIISIFGIQNNNRSANKYLALLILSISLVLIARVAMFYRDIFQVFPKLYLVPEFILFLYGPLFYTYIYKLSFKEKTWQKTGLHFIPFCIQLICYIPLWSMSNSDLILYVMNKDLDILFTFSGGIGLIFNFYYWYASKKILAKQSEKSYDYLSEEHKLNYLSGIMNVYVVCLIIWTVLYFSVGIAYLLSYEALHIKEFLIDTLWLTIAFVSFVMGYYAMNQAEILYIPEVHLNLSNKSLSSSVESKKGDAILSEIDLQLKKLLEIQMTDKTLYKNPRLNLTDLAKDMNCSTNDLSRVINDGFQKNFHDFINQYRIDAFIEEVSKDTKQEFTFLAHAYNVGFNSKTAFNRAFKKLVGATPSQYFQQKAG
ncbi:helix-turn-helix domain-containing protein [Sediminitomix flava]|uniref:Helix-turn-helix protein n=1 Tax=Sediminitomix flava TaxID=379075 RepID=A0A315YVH8_SEDFL|nr:helix-turn-helix domain-containing protein [Sediminitomix flava]PWJ33663.1 helix-turn-helix protein [Sediminitomix flava]